jgi:hypothetical protein
MWWCIFFPVYSGNFPHLDELHFTIINVKHCYFPTTVLVKVAERVSQPHHGPLFVVTLGVFDVAKIFDLKINFGFPCPSQLQRPQNNVISVLPVTPRKRFLRCQEKYTDRYVIEMKILGAIHNCFFTM